MADFSDKINELLSNPETLSKIMQIAKGLNLGGGTKSEETTTTAEVNAVVEAPAVSVEGKSDGGSSPVSGLASLLSSGNALSALGSLNTGTDKRITLLKAIKPFIAEHKHKRVDNIITAISISGALGSLKGG